MCNAGEFIRSLLFPACFVADVVAGHGGMRCGCAALKPTENFRHENPMDQAAA